MRSFIISLVILCLCLGACITNTVFTHRLISRCLEELDRLMPQDIDRFIQSWEKNSYYLSFTVKRTFLRDIADALQRLDAATEHNDEYEFEAARTALIFKMKELYRSQSFDIKSIL